jgi:hypothetical protein
MSEIKHKYFASIATKYILRIITFTTWCSLEDGPRWPKHVVNVIIRKVYLVAVEAKYLCFISEYRYTVLRPRANYTDRATAACLRS